MTLACLLMVVVPDVVLGGLVLWRMHAPPRLTRRATCWFAVGMVLSLSGLATGCFVTLGIL